ncbi:hypothetical protein J1763_gp66 [Gordonia phage YorkOnyx]|uniref:Uncharacterized protein n=1 Tax=Gordonia phage YorkOnyx TaxID=2762402 RepID=A0A7G8LMB5_9CAUD|nr:hypothetical protein J1763_gp66 [Gordonia phage YorkOnyx]QNJ58387.1 hypothetical protein SEA_YORKONYX_66 [Gordonia phage YorkOnyx]
MTDHPNVFADTQNRLCVHAPRTSLDKAPYVLGRFTDDGVFLPSRRAAEVPDGYYWAGAGARDLTAERRRRIEKRRTNDDQAFDDLLAGICTLGGVIATLTARLTTACEERDQQRARADAAEAELAEERKQP